VRLCDGHDYCANCLERWAPALAKDPKGNGSLTISDAYYSRRTIALRTAFYFVISTPAFTTVFFCAGLDLVANGKGTILEAIVAPPLLSIALNAFVYVLFVVGGLLMVRNPHISLTIANGAVSYSVRGKPRIVGRWDDFSFRVYPWNADPRLPWRTPILVLVYCKDGFAWRKMATVALTEETYNRWRGLLAITTAHK
jgi:hypothetical protein